MILPEPHSSGDLSLALRKGNKQGRQGVQKKLCTHNSESDFVTYLCDNIEWWDGVRGGREVQEGGNIHISMTDSC